MKSLCIIAGILAFSARTARSETCPLPPGVVKVDLPAGLPPALVKAVGDIALPGEAFNTTDVYFKDQKHRRYLFVWHVGNRWIVAEEIGGIALHSSVSVYELSKDGKRMNRIEERMAIRGDACETATHMVSRQGGR